MDFAVGYGLDYARTLAHWRSRFEGLSDKVAALDLTNGFDACWSFYLAYCDRRFPAGNIDALQVALVRKYDLGSTLFLCRPVYQREVNRIGSRRINFTVHVNPLET